LIIKTERGLEWARVYLYDTGADEDVPDYDPSEVPVFSTESTIIVHALPEGEGDVHLAIAFDEPMNASRAPLLLAQGVFFAPSGCISVNTSTWDEDIALTVPPGLYSYNVYTSSSKWPDRLLLTFRRAV
jgi:hypothetical protein